MTPLNMANLLQNMPGLGYLAVSISQFQSRETGETLFNAISSAGGFGGLDWVITLVYVHNKEV